VRGRRLRLGAKPTLLRVSLSAPYWVTDWRQLLLDLDDNYFWTRRKP
jgi:hypothetical protein